MNPFPGIERVQAPEIMKLIVAAGAAMVLGGLLAWRPLSRAFQGRPSGPRVAPALLLMTLASAFAMLVIGDSLARAFGVVGLGSFVRFRTSIKRPTDAVLFFVAIGVGMACALGMPLHAALAVGILSLVMIPIDRAARREAAAEADDPIEEPSDEVPLSGRSPVGRLRG
jgi:uncharacterized membrane protein YhiD involved in acid resistance